MNRMVWCGSNPLVCHKTNSSWINGSKHSQKDGYFGSSSSRIKLSIFRGKLAVSFREEVWLGEWWSFIGSRWMLWVARFFDNSHWHRLYISYPLIKYRNGWWFLKKHANAQRLRGHNHPNNQRWRWSNLSFVAPNLPTKASIRLLPPTSSPATSENMYLANGQLIIFHQPRFPPKIIRCPFLFPTFWGLLLFFRVRFPRIWPDVWISFLGPFFCLKIWSFHAVPALTCVEWIRGAGGLSYQPVKVYEFLGLFGQLIRLVWGTKSRVLTKNILKLEKQNRWNMEKHVSFFSLAETQFGKERHIFCWVLVVWRSANKMARQNVKTKWYSKKERHLDTCLEMSHLCFRGLVSFFKSKNHANPEWDEFWSYFLLNRLPDRVGIQAKGVNWEP